MRIIFLSYMESHSVKWVNALAERGHDIVFVAQKNPINQPEKLNKKISVEELPIKGKIGYFLNAPFLRKIAKRYRPDIINVHFASGYGTMARLARLDHILLSVWGSDVYDFPYKSKLCFNIIKKNLLYADMIASTSHCMATQVKRIIENRKEIFVPPFGVDVEIFKRKNNNKNNNELVIGNVKVVSKKYGIGDLIDAFILLREELGSNDSTCKIAEKLRCDIYGDGNQRIELETKVNCMNLDGCIKFHGFIDHDMVPDALNNIDIFCATSVLDSESFGVSVVEAQSVGLPVVVTDVDGFKEVVCPGVTGLIVPRGNVVAIKDALKELVLDETLRKTFGQNGRKRVLELYDFKKNVEQMEAAYREVAGKGW